MTDWYGVKAEICWNELRTRIFALAFKLTGNRFEADDLTQEAVLKNQEKIKDFRGESQLFTWVYRVVVNLPANVKIVHCAAGKNPRITNTV